MSAPVFYPALFYRDPAAALAWLERVFQFRKLVAYEGPDGRLAHVEMAFGEGVIMFGPADAARRRQSPLDLKGLSLTVYVYVADADAHYAHARAEGAEITIEIRDTEYGSREYSARDLEGQGWTFGTYRPAADDPPAA
jgi:uncharacterized glyoxalase superfamily protein PhnB